MWWRREERNGLRCREHRQGRSQTMCEEEVLVSWGRGVRWVKGKEYKGVRETGARSGAESTARGTGGTAPGAGDVSEVDRLRCLTADANEKGCAVRYVWAVGEGLTFGCGDPKGAAGAGCGGRGVGFNLSSSPRCCCHAPPRPPPPRAHDRTAPRPRSARQAQAPSTPALPRAPRAPSPAGTCRHRRCRRRRRHLQPATAPPRAPSARAAGGVQTVLRLAACWPTIPGGSGYWWT